MELMSGHGIVWELLPYSLAAIVVFGFFWVLVCAIEYIIEVLRKDRR